MIIQRPAGRREELCFPILGLAMRMYGMWIEKSRHFKLIRNFSLVLGYELLEDFDAN